MFIDELTVVARTTDAASEPVTLAEAKAQLRETGTDEDTYITTLITTAREFAEQKSNRAFLAQTWKATIDNGDLPNDSIIELPRPPLSSVTEITYLDAAGVSQTLSTDNYTVDTLSQPGRILFEDMPLIKATMNGLVIEYVAGYASAAAVPNIIKHAMLLLITHWFEIRQPVMVGTITSDVPISVKALLKEARMEWL